MKRYAIKESWHNGCDNAEDELYATCNNKQDAKEILLGLGHMMVRRNSLGDDFPKPSGKNKVQVSWLDLEGILTVWIGGKDSSPMGSEHRRIFRITEEKAPAWDFVHEQESLNPAFRGFHTGIISNGKDFLFYRANTEDNLCEVFGSLEEMCGEDSGRNALCSYPWTAENDSLLLDTLNANPFEMVYRYGTCDQSGTILKTIKFLPYEND